MASTHSKAFYDDETLRALELALRGIWQVLKAHEPYPNSRSPRVERRTLEGFPLSPTTKPAAFFGRQWKLHDPLRTLQQRSYASSAKAHT